MPDLWSTQRFHPKVRHLSDLLSRFRVTGKIARVGKIKLVSRPFRCRRLVCGRMRQQGPIAGFYWLGSNYLPRL